MTWGQLLGGMLEGLLRYIALLLFFLVGVAAIVRFHAPMWLLIPLLVAVCAIGSLILWLERRRRR